MLKHFASSFVACLLGLLIGCGGGGQSGGPTAVVNIAATTANVSVSGAVQKGPFIIGSTVLVNRLTATGANTGSTVVTNTVDNLGNFNFSANSGELFQITATGYYRNEITGGLSLGTLALRSVYQSTGAATQSAYVNLLTHIVSNRILNLVRTNNLPFDQAVTQAESEFLTAFSGVVRNTNVRNFTALSIFGDQQSFGSPYLLAMSSILYQYAIQQAVSNSSHPDAELTFLLNVIESDFGNDGIVNDPSILASLRTIIPSVNPVIVSQHVTNWIRNESGGLRITDINEFLDTDLDGVFNISDSDDDNDGINDAFDSSPHDPGFVNPNPVVTTDANTSVRINLSPANSGTAGISMNITAQPANGVVTGSYPELTYMPNTNYVGDDEFKYKLTQASVSSSELTVRVIIRPVINPAWTVLSAMPTGGHAPSAAATSSKIYVSGGFYSNDINPIPGSNYYRSTLQEYDVVSNSWVSKTNMDTARLGHTSHVIDNVLYVIGGEAGKEMASVEAYDIFSDTWSARSSLSIQRSLHASCVHDGKIYVFGGFTDNGIPNLSHTQSLSTVEMYTPATNSWIARTSMARDNWGMSCVTVNNKIYVFGGAGNEFGYEIYDPILNSWSLGGAIPTPRRYGFSASLVDDKIYLINVSGGNSKPLNGANDVLDLVSNTWSSKTPSSIPRYNMGHAVVGESIYLFGGRNNSSNNLNMVESYRPGFD